jgi:dipeptidyl aminopeptidase/acylaminoacyl peptidase
VSTRLLTIVAALFLFQGSRVDAQPPLRDITIDDYFSLAYITDIAISPDGARIAYAEWRWDGPDKPRDTDLWLVDTDGQNSRRLTFDPTDENAPRWSADGFSLYYLSSNKREGEKNPPYNGTTQVWRLDLKSGVTVPVTNESGGVNAYSLTPKGESIFYTTSKSETTGDWAELKKEFKDLKFGHGVDSFSVLWKLSLSDWRVKKVYDGNRFISAFDVNAAEDQVALITAPNKLPITQEGRTNLEIVEVATGESRTVPDAVWRKEAPSPYGWLEEPKWSPDGKHVAFTVDFDGFPRELILVSVGKEFTSRRLPRPTDVEVAGGLHWIGNGASLSFLGHHHATRRVFSFADVHAASAAAIDLTPGDVTIEAFKTSGDGKTMATFESTLTDQREVFVRRLNQKEAPKRVTHVNAVINSWKLPKISRVTWTGADGVQVEGLLELPADHQPGKPLPTIVNLHGGPKGCDNFPLQLHFMFYGRGLLAARGYAVLYVNYRGSNGYGDKFMTDLIGRENDVEVKDILAGVDHLIAEGIADKDRLGVMGWSNGGFLTNCLITGSERFAAASSGAGVFDQTMQWGEEDTPGHVINYLKGLPWEVPDEYRRASPLFHLNKNFRTATLIHVGEEDPRVPVTHSRTLHRALHEYLKVPTELVIYPGAEHGLNTYKHRLAKMKWDHAWFDKHLKK